MPRVGGKKYPYTAKGMKAAETAARKKGLKQPSAKRPKPKAKKK